MGAPGCSQRPSANGVPGESPPRGIVLVLVVLTGVFLVAWAAAPWVSELIGYP